MSRIGSVLMAVAALVAGSPAAAEERLAAEKVRAVEEILSAEMSRQRIPGLSVAVVVDGRPAWAAGYGLSDVENGVPATADTVYRTASIGKTITAAAAMQLAEGGQLDLDAPVRRYCPQFPEKRWPVTTRQLLAHLGGVRAYPEDPAELEAEFFSTRHYDDVVEPLDLFKDDPLLHEPGTRYRYSSYGYNVIGCAVAGAAGEPFLDYVRRHVFEPAGMSRTRDDDPSAIIPRRARGYVLTPDGELRNSRFVDMSNKMPAGGFLTTAVDLARFASALMGGEIVRPETLERMLQPQRTSDGERISYGLGWGLMPDETWYGEREAFHGGGTPQVSAMLYLLPDRGFAVALLMNREGVEDRVGTAARIAKVVLDLDREGDDGKKGGSVP